jgi:hypothetical protein
VWPPRDARPARTGAAAGGPLPLLGGLGIGLILLLLLLFLLFRRAKKLQQSPNEAVAYFAGRTVPSQDKSAPKPKPAPRPTAAKGSGLLAKATEKIQSPASRIPVLVQDDHAPPLPQNGPLLISLFVDDQNTHIGKRNIHAMKAGNRYSIGGGKSDYLIFLVPLPDRIGELYFDGRQFTFIPKKPQYFPELGDQRVSNCLGKTIKVMSDKRYELTFHLAFYDDPLNSLNRILNSVKVAGV